MLGGEIILENGDRRVFFLTDQQIRKLNLQVRKQNEYQQKKGIRGYWNMADELSFAIEQVLARMPDPLENETPAAGTAGESR